MVWRDIRQAVTLQFGGYPLPGLIYPLCRAEMQGNAFHCFLSCRAGLRNTSPVLYGRSLKASARIEFARGAPKKNF